MSEHESAFSKCRRRIRSCSNLNGSALKGPVQPEPDGRILSTTSAVRSRVQLYCRLTRKWAKLAVWPPNVSRESPTAIFAAIAQALLFIGADARRLCLVGSRRGSARLSFVADLPDLVGGSTTASPRMRPLQCWTAKCTSSTATGLAYRLRRLEGPPSRSSGIDQAHTSEYATKICFCSRPHVLAWPTLGNTIRCSHNAQPAVGTGGYSTGYHLCTLHILYSAHVAYMCEESRVSHHLRNSAPSYRLLICIHSNHRSGQARLSGVTTVSNRRSITMRPMTRALEVARSCRRAPTCVPRGRLCLRIWRNLTDVTQRLNKHDNGSVYMHFINRSTGEGICDDMARYLIYTTGPCSVLRRYEAVIHDTSTETTHVWYSCNPRHPTNSNSRPLQEQLPSPHRAWYGSSPLRTCVSTNRQPSYANRGKASRFLARAARAVRDQATQSLCIGLAPLAR